MKKINGDKIKGILNRFFYFYQCLVDQRKGINSYIEINNPSLLNNNLETYCKSPSRILCEAFWHSIDYKDLESQLKSKINFFDIGCGSGHHGNLYENLSKSSFESYTGLDIYKHDKFPEKFKHIIDKAESISKHINKKINFVTSQSSLEHIEQDTLVLRDLTKKLVSNKLPFVQIHMLPASRALWLYLWHGYRQYSKKNIANLVNEIKNDYGIEASLIPIGGSNSFWTHLRYITLPVYKGILFRKKNFKWFFNESVNKKIIKSISKEFNCVSKNPIFWALIINSKDIRIKYVN